MRLRHLIVGIVLVLAQSAALAQSYPPPWPRDGVKKVFENDRVIVWEVEWLTEPTGMHEHRYDLVVITTRTGTIGITTPDGKTITLEAKAGDVGFQAAGVIHDEHSMSDPARTAMVIELKD